MSPSTNEITCAVYRNKSGLVYSIQLLRKLNSGVTSWAKVINDNSITKLCSDIANSLDVVGSINIQLINTNKGPYIFEINEIRIKYIYLFTVFLCLNSLIFESGDRYQFTYFLKSSLFHFFKIIIFSINCFYFGKILNKYIEINFNSLKFKIN